MLSVTRLHLSLDTLDAAVRTAVPSADRAAAALWRRDASLWSADAGVQKAIANRLGWLDSPQLMANSIQRLTSFAASIRAAGFSDVVLLGMGGSSLAPEVLSAIVGVAPGWPRFQMLDSTDPAAVRAAATPPKTTLYILASKSGGTIEPNSLAAHFRATLEAAGMADWAKHFIAITDEGTGLAKRARDEHFRDVFINPSDIGGRYSALSFFGMVPAALMGQDIASIVARGQAMLEVATKTASSLENPAVALGLAMATAARAGRDKLTLLLPDRFEAFGLWVEQLVAESTGKNGVGIVPIAGERPADQSAYGADRFFVDARGSSSAPLTPSVTVDWTDPLQLGAEFVRWEIATAVAGALLGINPFDEPNVQQAKDATNRLLAAFKSQGALPASPADVTVSKHIELTASAAAKSGLGARDAAALLTLLKPGDYFAQLAYVSPSSDVLVELERLREAVRTQTKVATTLGVGPRYLHSTGQLHKGGPNTGVFLLITASPATDVDIPGQPYGFATLQRAQALGDFASLEAAHRRAVHAHLPSADREHARSLVDALIAAMSA
jgi:glucose-6-phosphate isomerase